MLFKMRRIITIVFCILASACGVKPQPGSVQTVAAFEVPLPSPAERERFLAVLREIAEDHAMHVDAATEDELARRARDYPALKMTMSAAIWRGKNDDESIASAVDHADHLGQVWIIFSKGEDPDANRRFREATMAEVMRKWPQTLPLPVMPTGSIPLRRDLIRTPKGYVLDPSKAREYGVHERGGGA
jgi:hypothetical protein